MESRDLSPSGVGPETRATGKSGIFRGVRRRRNAWIAVLLAGILVVAAYGIYAELTLGGCPGAGKSSDHTLVVDVYPSFMGSGSDPAAARNAVFEAFANATGSHVVVNNISGEDVATAVSQASSCSRPDIVIGVDEVTTEALGTEGLLIPYSPPALSQVNATLIQDLSPQHYATPYEFGYLGLDYLTAFNNSTSGQLGRSDFFQALVQNSSLASNFSYENPTQSITGKEFLLWEYEFYTHVLHQNWTTFWSGAGPHLGTAFPDWTDGINAFGPSHDANLTCVPRCYPMFVSYSTDPAYYATYPPGFSMNTTFAWYNGHAYTWETIYGVGIVKAPGENLTLAEKFVDWMLGPQVQSLVPLNEWEYPANGSIPVPSVYRTNPAPSDLVVLNGKTNPLSISQELTGLLLEWQNLMAATGSGSSGAG